MAKQRVLAFAMFTACAKTESELSSLQIIYENVTSMWNDFLSQEQMEKATKTEEFEGVRQ